MMTEDLYHSASEIIEKTHSEDGSRETEDGAWYPSELLYGKRMLTMLEMVSPGSAYAMKLAVQC